MAIQLQPSPALNWLRSPRLGTWLHHSETGSESSPPWLGKANMTSARPPLQRWKWAKTGQKLVTGANWCHFQLGKNLPFYGLVKRQQFHSASERKLHLFSDVQLPPLKKPGCVFWWSAESHPWDVSRIKEPRWSGPLQRLKLAIHQLS